jgi:hypothetical protein
MARGKFNKRGGGPRLDPVNAEEIELRNTRLAELDEERTARRADSDDDESEDEKDGLVLTDADREKKKKEKKAADKKKKEDKKKAAAAAAANPDAAAVDGAEAEPEEIPLSRKDMPEIITTEADHKRNLGKLAQVRKRREEADARRKMEEEAEVEKEEMARAKIAAVTLEDIDADDDKKKKKKKSKEEKIPKLGKIDIKKMKPAQMKEALKERGLEIQGNATALQARLTAFEAAR